MRLHNRVAKASFWDDLKLLRLPRDARTLFHGLWHLADDSGCLEYDCSAFKTFLFKSPVDADLTIERLEELTRLLIDAGLVAPRHDSRRRLLVIRDRTHLSSRLPVMPLAVGGDDE